MMHKKASTVSIGGVPTVYPGKGAAGSGSGSIWERKKVAAALTGGLLTTTSGKAVVGTATQKKAAAALSGGLPTTTPRKGAVGMAMKKKAAAALSRGLPTTNPGKGAVGTGSSGKMQKKATVVSSRGGSPRWGRDITNTERGRANGKTLLEPEASPRLPCGTGLPAATGERKHKNSSPSSPRNLSRVSLRQQLRASRAPALGSLTNVWDEINAHARAGSPLGARHANRTSHGSEESAPKHHAVEKTPKGPSGNMPQKGCTADTALRRGMLQKNQAKVKSGKGLGAQILHKKQSSSLQADTGLNGKIPHEHPAKEAQTDTDETVHVEENIHLQEAKLLIQKLNKLGLGEHISHEDFLVYYERLPNPPPSIDTDIELEAEKLRELGFRHALYRFQYCKYKLSKKGNNLEDDWPPNPFDGGAYGTRLKANDLLNIPEADCTPTFIEEQGYFKRFERDGTLDWSFPSDYINCALLNDYQRLVPRNYGGTEYIRWSEYHEYLHSYEIEQEYVEYCEELAKQLKWMEDYIHFDRPSFKYDFISSRGAYQAIKIAATGFREITPALAYNGYYECIESMGYDLAWLKELDCVYFEIWQRVTQGMSFKDALAEVCHLNRFPLSQDKMEHALEFDEAMEEMEEEFRICTAAITPEVKGDKARELIAGAVKELLDDTPKTYEQYIIKKMHIARVVGILPPKRIEDSEEWDNRQTSGCL